MIRDKEINELVTWKQQVRQPLQALIAQSRNWKRPRNVGGGGYKLLLCVMDEDIAFGETKPASEWDATATPPTDKSEDPIQVTHDWWRDNPQTITAGKRVGVIQQGDTFRIHFAECEDPEPVQV